MPGHAGTLVTDRQPRKTGSTWWTNPVFSVNVVSVFLGGTEPGASQAALFDGLVDGASFVRRCPARRCQRRLCLVFALMTPFSERRMLMKATLRSVGHVEGDVSQMPAVGVKGKVWAFKPDHR